MNCKKCEDRKHILVSGRYVPCDCLIEHRIISSYQKSKIPPFFYNYTWMDFLQHYPNMKKTARLCKKIIKRIKQQKKVKFVYIKGESNSGKMALISMFLKEFIGARMTCKLVSLDEIIKMEFDKEEKTELQRIYDFYDVVCLRIGTVMEHSYARPVLEKFYTQRKNNNKYAMFSSRLDLEKSQGLYGIEFAKIINDGRRILKIKMR